MAAAAISRQGPGPIKLHAERERNRHRIKSRNQRPVPTPPPSAPSKSEQFVYLHAACLRQWTDANFVISHVKWQEGWRTLDSRAWTMQKFTGNYFVYFGWKLTFMA
jgi:hypothetical protein